MVNLLLVGSGKVNEVKSFVSFLQDYMCDFCKKNNGVVYDDKTLERAEGNPKLLRQKAYPQFSTFRNTSKAYTGIFNAENVDDLYAKLYEIMPVSTDLWGQNDLFNRDLPNYRIEDLPRALKSFFDESKYSVAEPYMVLCDFQIDYSYCIEKGLAFTTIALRINETFSKSPKKPFWKSFSQIINILDERFPNVFSSAYITNNVSEFVTTAHLELYKNYEITDTNKYLLGVEYSVYAGKSVCAHCNISNKVLTGYETVALKNGFQFTSLLNIDEFCQNHISEARNALKEALIPAFYVCECSSILEANRYYRIHPQMVHLYTNIMDMFDFNALAGKKITLEPPKESTFNPMVVFSYNMPNEVIDVLDDLNGGSLIARFCGEEV